MLGSLTGSETALVVPKLVECAEMSAEDVLDAASFRFKRCLHPLACSGRLRRSPPAGSLCHPACPSLFVRTSKDELQPLMCLQKKPLEQLKTDDNSTEASGSIEKLQLPGQKAAETWLIPSWQPTKQQAAPQQHWAGSLRIVIEGSWADAAEAEWAEEAASNDVDKEEVITQA